MLMTKKLMPLVGFMWTKIIKPKPGKVNKPVDVKLFITGVGFVLQCFQQI
jgi:hypothetical protein